MTVFEFWIRPNIWEQWGISWPTRVTWIPTTGRAFARGSEGDWGPGQHKGRYSPTHSHSPPDACNNSAAADQYNHNPETGCAWQEGEEAQPGDSNQIYSSHSRGATKAPEQPKPRRCWTSMQILLGLTMEQWNFCSKKLNVYTLENLHLDNCQRSRIPNKYWSTDKIRSNHLQDKSNGGGGGVDFLCSANQIKIVGTLDFTDKSTSSNDALLKS